MSNNHQYHINVVTGCDKYIFENLFCINECSGYIYIDEKENKKYCLNNLTAGYFEFRSGLKYIVDECDKYVIYQGFKQCTKNSCNK